MTLYIEYYEVGDAYWFMPIDSEAKHKENFDNRSTRVWRFNTRTNRVQTIMDRSKGLPEPNRAEFLKIQLLAKPVPFEDYYLQLQEMKRYREQHSSKESSDMDQVQDT